MQQLEHRFGHAIKKIQRGRLSVQGKGIWTTTSTGRYRQSGSGNICAKPQKVCKKRSMETQIPRMTLRCAVRKRLRMTLYKLQLVQALNTDDRERRKQFCVAMQEKLEDEELKSVLFSVMRLHFIRVAKSTSIMFAFGGKKIPMPQLST